MRSRWLRDRSDTPRAGAEKCARRRLLENRLTGKWCRLLDDFIGTPYCITVDFDTLEDDAVTIRERDSTKQERIGLGAVVGYLPERLTDL